MIRKLCKLQVIRTVEFSAAQRHGRGRPTPCAQGALRGAHGGLAVATFRHGLQPLLGFQDLPRLHGVPVDLGTCQELAG